MKWKDKSMRQYICLCNYYQSFTDSWQVSTVFMIRLECAMFNTHPNLWNAASFITNWHRSNSSAQPLGSILLRISKQVQKQTKTKKTPGTAKHTINEWNNKRNSKLYPQRWQDKKGMLISFMPDGIRGIAEREISKSWHGNGSVIVVLIQVSESWNRMNSLLFPSLLQSPESEISSCIQWIILTAFMSSIHSPWPGWSLFSFSTSVVIRT